MGRFLSPGVSPIKSTHRENKNKRSIDGIYSTILDILRFMDFYNLYLKIGMVRTYVMNLNEAIGIRVASKFRGAGEAIHKGYLREFMIVVSCNENDEDDAIEVYTWRMRYGNDGVPSAEFIEDPTFPNFRYNSLIKYLGLDLCILLRLIVNVKSVFIDDSYTMEMRMKESSSANTSHDEPLNDSLNDSFGDDRGENDQHNTSVESTELSPPQRSDNIEEPVNTSTTGIHGNQNDEASYNFKFVIIRFILKYISNSLSPEDAPQKRGRGKKATAVTQKKSPAFVRGVQKVHKSPHRAKSTHITPPRLRATPGRASKGVTPGSSPPLSMRK
uniref:HORMA domain-containing protein n=1 Tax=Heterorhabditis bacteriophora TaxID=37862 RepID=A0A1I7WI03_HETBA